MSDFLNHNEILLLQLIANHGGITNSNKVFDDVQGHIPMSLEQWKLTHTSEPNWRFEIRKSFQILKDYDLVTGTEFGEWHITKLGYQFIQNHEQKEVQKAPRVINSTLRIIRDSKIVEDVKSIYKFRCQVCSQQIHIASGVLYIEAHHLMPLGEPHNGPDIISNLIVLCPNHHVLFDYSIMAINPTTMNTELLMIEDSKSIIIKSLDLMYHNFDIHCLEYQYSQFLKRKST